MKQICLVSYGLNGIKIQSHNMLSPCQSHSDQPDINHDINDLIPIERADIGLLIKFIEYNL